MAKRSRTRIERIPGLTLSSGLSAFVLWLILHYTGLGGSTVSSWVARFIMADVAVVAILGLLLLARSVWRYAVTRPLPGGRANAWFVRQPWWIVALIYWAAFGGPSLAVGLWTGDTRHLLLDRAWPGGWVLASGIYSVFMAVMLRALWRRQAENTARDSGGPIARGSHDGA